LKIINTNIIIVGAGLTGLTLAYYLKNHQMDVAIVEARNRLGGRILTKQKPNSANIELGATWLGKQHIKLLHLLGELQIQIFEQEMGNTAIYEIYANDPFEIVDLPKSDDPSYRIKNGTHHIINSLVEKIDASQIYTGQAIGSIIKTNNFIEARSDTHIFKGSVIISTLPPLLFAESIHVDPPLPNELIEIAEKTHTWMGNSIKVGLSFDQKLWIGKNRSGTIFSNVGPINEMYDHSNFEDTLFALKGFLNESCHSMTKKERLKLIINQLE
jgi:monoamine oxidase